MPTVYTLGANLISVSGGKTVSGVTGGDGSHLNGETITLNANSWTAIDITDTSDANFQDNQPASQSLTNAISFNNTTYAAGLQLEAEYTVVVEDSLGNEYTLVAFNIREPGEPNAFGSVEGLAFVGGVGGFPPIGEPLTFVSNQEGPSVPYADLATPPCFTTGSLVATAGGATRIEDLQVGDMVWTLDRGPQPLRWIARTRFPASALKAQPELCPVRIRKNAFGLGNPVRDTLVSQCHRIFVSGAQAAMFYGEDEVLVPAKKMINDRSITIQYDVESVEYFHLIFDQHEVLRVDGLLSESFLVNQDADQVLPIDDAFLASFDAKTLGEMCATAARPLVEDRFTSLLQD